MRVLDDDWVPRSPFSELPSGTPSGAGVVVHDCDGLGIASVRVRRGRYDALARRVKERLGVELLTGARCSSSGGVAFIGTGPGSWLATSEGTGNGFASSLMVDLGDCAAISDQSDGHAVLRLSGPKVGEALSKLVPIDLHPRAYTVGMASVTMIAHIGVTLWRLENEPNGNATFDMAVYRSLAESLWDVVSQSAAQFGLQFQQAQSHRASYFDACPLQASG